MADVIQRRTMPLAWDKDNQPFEVPEAAELWRVRESTGKPGRTPAVWTHGGVLHLPLEADLDDLRQAVGNRNGTFRLHPVDRFGAELEPVAHIELVGGPVLRQVESLAMTPADTAPALDGIPGRMAAEIPHRFFDLYERMLTSRDAHDEVLGKLMTTLVVSTANIQQSTAGLLGAANATVKVANGVDALERVSGSRTDALDALDVEGLTEKVAAFERLHAVIGALGKSASSDKPETPWIVQLLNGPMGMGLMNVGMNFAKTIAAAQAAQSKANDTEDDDEA